MRPPLVVVVNPAFGFGEQLPDGPVAHSSEHGMLELTDQPFGPAVVRWCSGPAHAGDEIPSNEFVDHRIAAVLATLVGMPDNGTAQRIPDVADTVFRYTLQRLHNELSLHPPVDDQTQDLSGCFSPGKSYPYFAAVS